MKLIILLLIVIFISSIYGSHFRGGIISWRPLNKIPSGNTVQIQVCQRYSWRLGSKPCTDATIAHRGLLASNSILTCYTGSCSTSGWGRGVTTNVFCTDYSVGMDLSSGERYDTFTLRLGISISVGFSSSAWLSNLVVGRNSPWDVINRISTVLRPDGSINTSPVATTLPVIYKSAYTQHVHVVQISDGDSGDILKCRWSIRTTANINSYNECGGVCSGVPNATLSSNNCTITFTLSFVNKFYAIALQIEDYYSSSSTTAMSSVPIQFLFYSYAAPSGCSTPPAIIGARPNRACIGIMIGSNVTEYVIAQVYCTGKTITDFVTNSPVGMKKSNIINLGSGLYQIMLSWIPQTNQFGPQGFCAGAVDNTKVQSDQWCITFLVGFQSPNLVPITTIQGTASPIGTVFANQTIFSIQATRQVNRPTRNGTYVYFSDAITNIVVYSMDCGWSPNVLYTDRTIVFYIPSPPWIPGHSYYITFDSGVASGTEFCGPESSPITDHTFWSFNIWNPSLSSTMTTITTRPTVGTVTTRGISKASVNTALTTTGIVHTTQFFNTALLITSTITTISDSPITITITSTISNTTTTATTTLSSVNATYPKDMEKACEQPIVIMNILVFGTMALVHTLSMYVAFIKFTNIFEPNRVQAQKRREERRRNVRHAWVITKESKQIDSLKTYPTTIERKKRIDSKRRSNKVYFIESLTT